MEHTSAAIITGSNGSNRGRNNRLFEALGFQEIPSTVDHACLLPVAVDADSQSCRLYQR